MDPPGIELDEEQDVQSPQPDGVEGEEVTRHGPGGLLAQERPPGCGRPARGGIQPMTAKGVADRRCRDPHAKAQELALDPLVAPAGVLPSQAEDQLLYRVVEWWSPYSSMRVGPGASDQPPVPAQQGLRLDEKAGPARPRQYAADGSEQGPVGGF